MKKHLLLFVLALTGCASLSAQIADGSIAPDFTATDLNGNTYNLYDLLAEGKTVFLDVSATWCGPCWNYHNNHALRNIWDEYGPDGTNEAFVFFAEGDPNTNENCLYGPSGCVGGTQGNWVDGTPYPIIHNEGPSIASLYQITYYPTIFCICPYDQKVYECGQLSKTGLWNFRNSHCGPPPIAVTNYTTTRVKCYGTNTGGIDITPTGGVPPFTYLWSNGATTQDLTNVPAGTYTVTVNGQVATQGVSDPIEVEGPAAPLTLALESFTAVGCNGILGSATVIADGGWNANYTYNWQNGQHGETAYNLNVGNHTVSVTDDNNCKVSLVVNMAPPVYPTATIATPGVITCNQPSIQLNANGSSGGPEFTYQWFAANGGHIVSGGTTLTPTVDAGGNYTIQVTNTQNTCASYATKNVNADNDPPAANAGPAQAISCAMPEATLQGSGSTGNNFTYLWTVADGGNIVSGGNTLNPVVNAAGSYTLKVSNIVNGCTQTATTTVTGTPAPTLATTSGSLTCAVAALTLGTTTNAVSPTFAWTGPNGYASSLQSPTVNESGSYVVVVTDSVTTCTSTATALVVSNTNAPGASASGDTLSCVILNTIITASTPDTNAVFAWTGPNGFSSSLQNPNVNEAGAYNLVVTDTLNGCSSTASATVILNNIPPVASALTPGNFNCNTAQLQLNGTGSSQGANFTYAWTALDGGHIVSGENTQTPLVDAVGAYAILVTNTENGCAQADTVAVVQSQAVAANIAAQTSVGCNGGNNGAATALGGGGNGAYTYAWSNGASTATATDLVAGTYVVVVTDGENCTASTTVNIAQPDVLAANASATAQTAFAQNDGTATANPSGGNGNYSYAWDNGASTQTIEGLAPGSYGVVVTDANGCTAVQSVTVNAFNCTLAVSISGSNLTCNGAHDGSASISVSTAADPLNYVWSNGGNTQTISNLAAGLYTVNITDGDNCPAVLNINITEPSALFANAIANAESALGANDGTASATPTGGTAPYTFAWSNGETSQSISQLAPGVYTVVVTDANNCNVEQQVEVNSFLCVIASENIVVNVSCAGAANGSVTVVLNGGTAPFNYTWSNGGNEATIADLGSGTYTLQVTDANGCDFSTSAVVTEPLPYSDWGVQVSHPLCPDDATGEVLANISGGTPPYSFLWNTGATGNLLSNATPGVYTVQVTDANGCQSSISATLVSTDSEAPSVSAHDAVLALGANGTAHLELADIGAQFSDNCGIVGTSISPQTFDCLQIGKHDVTLSVTDPAGHVASVTVTVDVVDQIVPTLTCPADMVVCSYNNVVAYASPSAEDNCLLAGNGNWQLLGGLPSGATFPEGTSIQTYTYTDASGNTGACSFSVTVTSAVSFAGMQINHDVDGQHLGSIDISVQGGAGPYSFEWTNENGNVVSNNEDLTGLGQGTYAVQVTDANNCVYTIGGIKVENTVDVKEPLWLNGMSLQPNPTSGLTRIVFNELPATSLEIAIVDATGRVLRNILSDQQQTVELDCSDLPGGVYLIRFRSGQEMGVRKLVVSR